MLKNYLKSAVRGIARHKVNSTINILGLALGLTCCILIYLYVSDELSYDNFHQNKRLLFRVLKISYDNSDGRIRDRGANLPPAMGTALTEYFPGIKYLTRFWSVSGVVRNGDKIFREPVHLADLPFFKMFTFPLIFGNPETVLSQHNAIVLTQRYAKKYFGDENPVGKTLTITYGEYRKDYMVTGVAKDLPRNSSIQFNLLINISNLPQVTGVPQALSIRDNQWLPVFVQLEKNVSAESIEGRFNAFTTQFFSSQIQRYKEEHGWTRKENPYSFALQKMTDVYLDNDIGLIGKGLASSFILIGIAFMVLVIAGINFMNLSIGMSSDRSLEIGMRKVVGAEKRQLLEQFLSESLVMACIAMAAGMLFAELLLPEFNRLANKQLSIMNLMNIPSILALVSITVIAGILAGSYPAVVMSAFKPVDIIKGKLTIGTKTMFSKSSVVVQFALSIILIISAIVMGEQLKYLVHRDIGYKKEGLVAILTQNLSTESKASQRIVNLFRDKVIQHNHVLGVTASSAWFGISGAPQWSLKKVGKKIKYHWNRVDNNFVRTLGLEILQGRDFSQNAAADSDAVIVNQTFVQALGMESPLGKTIGEPSLGFPYHLRIIGVVKDFHYGSLKYEILPAIFHTAPIRAYNRMLVKISTKNIKETMTFLANTWKQIQPEKPFMYNFHEAALENLYTNEKRWSTIAQYSSILAVLVACMGIFGLTALTINRRVKEIGIRKVFGAKISQVVKLVIKDFVILVAIANLIAWPVVYYVMRKVLQDYPYRVGIGIHYFLVAGVISLIIAVLTIMSLTVKAARSNPANAIRDQ
jgi:putative ABC transport system permease protein